MVEETDGLKTMSRKGHLRNNLETSYVFPKQDMMPHTFTKGTVRMAL